MVTEKSCNLLEKQVACNENDEMVPVQPVPINKYQGVKAETFTLYLLPLSVCLVL